MNDKLRKALFYVFMTIAIVYGLYLHIDYSIERIKLEPKELYYEYLCFDDISGSDIVDFKYSLQRTYTSLEKKLVIELPVSKIAEYYQSEAKKNAWLNEDITKITDGKLEMRYKKNMLRLFIRIIDMDKYKCTVIVYMSAPKTQKEKSLQRRAYLEQ